MATSDSPTVAAPLPALQAKAPGEGTALAAGVPMAAAMLRPGGASPMVGGTPGSVAPLPGLTPPVSAPTSSSREADDAERILRDLSQNSSAEESD